LKKDNKQLLGLYMPALDGLKEYVVLFQCKDPMVHVLHDKQEQLLQKFLCGSSAHFRDSYKMESPWIITQFCFNSDL